MELLQVDMGIYHLKIHFKVVRIQMSHCYLCSKTKTNMKKWDFGYFIADYFPALNKQAENGLQSQSSENGKTAVHNGGNWGVT